MTVVFPRSALHGDRAYELVAAGIDPAPGGGGGRAAEAAGGAAGGGARPRAGRPRAKRPRARRRPRSRPRPATATLSRLRTQGSSWCRLQEGGRGRRLQGGPRGRRFGARRACCIVPNPQRVGRLERARGRPGRRAGGSSPRPTPCRGISTDRAPTRRFAAAEDVVVTALYREDHTGAAIAFAAAGMIAVLAVFRGGAAYALRAVQMLDSAEAAWRGICAAAAAGLFSRKRAGRHGGGSGSRDAAAARGGRRVRGWRPRPRPRRGRRVRGWRPRPRRGRRVRGWRPRPRPRWRPRRERWGACRRPGLCRRRRLPRPA